MNIGHFKLAYGLLQTPDLKIVDIPSHRRHVVPAVGVERYRASAAHLCGKMLGDDGGSGVASAAAAIVIRGGTQKNLVGKITIIRNTRFVVQSAISPTSLFGAAMYNKPFHELAKWHSLLGR